MIALGIESSGKRGMGHLFRSLLYVKYFRKNNIQFLYLINNDRKSLDILDENRIPYKIVDYYDLKSDWEGKLIDSYGIDLWINDKFETNIYMARHIKNKNIYFALIDDIGKGESIADINYIGLTAFSKKTFGPNSVCSGMDYVILNDEIDKYKRIRHGINRVIVSFGGSDPYSNTVPVVRRLLQSDIEFDITIGPNYKCERELEEFHSDTRFKIYKNVPSLIELFSNYDLVITGGGVTCCEANAAGLPCIIIANAPHEVNTGTYLQEYGSCIYLGDYNGWNKDIIDVIKSMDIERMSIRGMSIFKTNAVDNILSSIIKKSYKNEVE